MSRSNFSYITYKKIIEGKRLPLAYVDMDMLDKNIRHILEKSEKKSIRLASASIRCNYLLDYILKANPQFRGILSSSGEEAVFLSKKGFDNILIGSPVTNIEVVKDICHQIKNGSYINLMTDKLDQVHMINEIGEQFHVKVPISVDINMSVDFPGLHFGVWRSSQRRPNSIKALLEEIRQMEFAWLDAAIGHDSRITASAEKAESKWMINNVIPSLKKFSINKIADKRKKVVEMIKTMGFDLKVVNGGRIAKVETPMKEEMVTEISAGSEFFTSQLADKYEQASNKPVAGIACAINRQLSQHVFACAGGRFIINASSKKSEPPTLFLPDRARIMKNDCIDEALTSILYKGNEKLKIGDAVFFQNSCVGELSERFNFIHLIRGDKIEQEVPTYRGEGHCFF